ncbi:MptD family putative ECF transporter S component [uncultured Clostridium sp.]|uniref:MptD family putative ECF transporter S component n=1 Tax=uncultured Clostridium sp. TaxID=59620 RepID=UPI0025DD2310|nr:MptD family putative ECF transporter S component [uncultured Clostridium sp.]
MNNKLQAKDLINIGLFTALYFIIGCAVAIPIGFIPIFMPILGPCWILITGIIFMIFSTKVKKFGMVTIMAILSGMLMGLTGMGFWGMPLGIVSGFIGDWIMKSGEYKSVKKNILGYSVFSLWMIGTYVPMYFMADKAYADFASGFGEEYAAQVMSVMPTWSIILVIIGCFLCGIIGGLIGKAVLRKHFEKAGIV